MRRDGYGGEAPQWLDKLWNVVVARRRWSKGERRSKTAHDRALGLDGSSSRSLCRA